MKFSHPHSSVFVPGGSPPRPALARTTDLCIAAHQDDIEIMAYGPIAACYDDPNRFFTGCVVTDGAGSPRSGPYEATTDERMRELRVIEQENAARIGRYSAQVFLSLPSAQVKDGSHPAAAADLEQLLLAAAPDTVYTHNLADKHDTHVAAALRVIEALRRLPEDKRPLKVYSMEVWRGLDWLCDGDKALFDTSSRPELAAALLEAFDSQIAGGKRYDRAALGRRLANATFFSSRDTDGWDSLSFGLDITGLAGGSASPEAFISQAIERFSEEVRGRIREFQ